MTLQEIRAWYRVRPGYWFAPKLYGFGATPVRWQGWALVLAFVLVAGGVVWLAKRYTLGLGVLLVPLLAGFVYLCWARTDGGWKWRWGPDR